MDKNLFTYDELESKKEVLPSIRENNVSIAGQDRFLPQIETQSQPNSTSLLTLDNNITVFSNETLGSVRTILKDGDPLFCLSDIAKILEHSNPARIKEWLDSEFGKRV